MTAIRDSAGVLHVVGLSGGKDSTATALLLAEREPRPYTYVCTPTGNEPAAMFAHWRKLGELLGRQILPIMATWTDKETGKTTGGLEALIKRENSLPNRRARWCTRVLKIEPYGKWLAEQAARGPVVSYIGLRADEPTREGAIYGHIPGVAVDFPLRRFGVDLTGVIDVLQQRGVTIPDRTDCKICFWQRLIEWWELWTHDRQSFDVAVEMERQTGHTFRVPKLNSDGSPVLTTRWPRPYPASWRDTWPCSLADMADLFAQGFTPPDTKARDGLREIGSCRACTL